MTDFAIEVTDLTYEFPHGSTKRIGLEKINLKIPWGTTNLIVGPNGAGKSTLLKILAGKTLIKQGKLKIGGFDPFEFNIKRNEQHNSDINKYITYLGTEWITNSIIKRDIPVNLLIDSVGGNLYQEKRDLLIDILDIDPSWSMINLSDGERRRRVQIAMGLIKPWKLLLLDEVTIDLDVVVRSKLLNYLKSECENGSTVVYATHIFDGLGENWCDRIIHLDSGLKLNDIDIKDIEFNNHQEIVEKDDKIIIGKSNSLHPLALHWLNIDLERRGSRQDEKLKLSQRHNDFINSRDGKYFDADDSKLQQYFKSTRSNK